MEGMEILKDFKVAVLVTDGFEEAELVQPVRALREAGASVDIVSLNPGRIQAFKHLDKTFQVKADRAVDEIAVSDYQGVLLPGGGLNADALRADERILTFVKGCAEAGLPIAAICHAPWILISAGLVKGVRLTSYHTIKDDLINAGADRVDEEVVCTDKLVTSRQPEDIPAFNNEVIRLFAECASRSVGAKNAA
jgi:protease I